MQMIPDDALRTIVAGFDTLMELYIDAADARTAQALAELRCTPPRHRIGRMDVDQMLHLRDSMKCIEKLRAGGYLR